jgi:putative two-component system response regulator
VNRRVLIIDDSADDLEMLERILANEATAIRGVTDSAQAEWAFQDFEPDVVLLDLHMPDPDGLEILRRLRRPRTAMGFLPVIVLTGDTGKAARNSALILGADDFLTKPLDRREVLLRVRNLLRTRQLYVELAEANQALVRRLPQEK